jgi:hypothetical protein
MENSTGLHKNGHHKAGTMGERGMVPFSSAYPQSRQRIDIPLMCANTPSHEGERGLLQCRRYDTFMTRNELR